MRTISIIVAVYNSETSLPRALNSVVKQTFKDWETIIVDDGSVDNSLAVARSFELRDKRFKVYGNKHKGRHETRNFGLQQATGRYITLLDHDDEYRPNNLEARLAYLQAHPEFDIIHGGMEVVGDPMVPDRYDQSKLIDVHVCVLCGTIFGKKIVFDTLGGFRNVYYADDADFIDRAAEKFSVGIFNEPTYIYHRENKDSITHTIARNHNGLSR